MKEKSKDEIIELMKQRREKVKVYSLVQLAQDIGYTPIRIGRNYFTLKEHDSVRININTNTFKQYSTGIFGDPVSFLLHFGVENRSPKFGSINYCLFWLEKKLNIENTVTIKKMNYPKEQKQLILPKKDSDYKRIFAYLIKTRKIDKDIVSAFVNRKMLYQSKV